ncbi:MAG: cation diffusion facilitator family transporter [Bacteroidales bacterium]|jgi:cobalt-zinc-cadmium efflux system protein|nr:cation diffusion facilitator family transporter [Bacteroidales bacterium]
MHKHNHDENQSLKNIGIALVLNFTFTIAEFIGGILTNSIAIVSDAVHDLGDTVSLGCALYFEKLSKRSPNMTYSYGYKRFSMLGALINCVVLLVGSVFVIYKAINRIIEPEEVEVKGMLLFAIAGVIINGIAVLRTRKGKGVNERVVSLHLLEDVLGWVAVLIISIVMMFVDVPILDPLLSIGIALFILYNVVRNLKITLNVFLEGVPSDMNILRLKQKIESIPVVVSVHDLHVWSLDSVYNIASIHVVVEMENNSTEALIPIKEQIRRLMKEEAIEHVTIEFEDKNEHCIPCDKEIIKTDEKN